MSITTLVVIGMVEVFLIALAFLSAYKDKNEQKFVAEILNIVSDEEKAKAVKTWQESILK